jgi:hypothetical protein
MVLLAAGAMAVDIGQAYAKKSLLQTDVDLAVMAATAELTSGGECNPEVVTKATEFLNKADNSVPGQYTVDLGGSPSDQDGYIHCHDWRVDLYAPKSHVDFGLGKAVMSEDGIDVQAHAAAQVKAATSGATLPFFSSTGCDYGSQSIRNDSHTPSAPVTPTLTPDSGTHNDATFTITPNTTPSATTALTIQLTGKKMKGAVTVGFTGASGHYTVTGFTVPDNTETTLNVAVPSGVLAVDDVWYVRVLIGSKWSDPTKAQPLTVGPPRLYCDASNEGNFGTVDVPRSDTNSNVLEWNMILGLEPSLALHPTPSGECSGQPGSVESKTAPVNGTNCIATEPGLKIAQTNEGLVKGAGGKPGRLDAPSTSNCSRNHDNGRTAGQLLGKNLNDDLLTCFIVNGAHISDLVAGNVVGTNALSGDIVNSPRFFWIPVLERDPSTGKKSWPIVDFRAGFITDQSLSATHDAPGAISTFNGLEADSSGIREVRVVLFSTKALPAVLPAKGGEADYTGSGPKAIVLVE